MTDVDYTGDAECPIWEPPDHAVSLGCFGDGTDGRRIVLLAVHPTWPYEGRVENPDADAFEQNLKKLAFCYLKALKDRFEAQCGTFLPAAWMTALDPGNPENPFMLWLDIDTDKPIASRGLARNDDQTIVLVAGRTTELNTPWGLFNLPPSGFGVRIVMRRLRKDAEDFAITSMTAHLPDAQYTDQIVSSQLAFVTDPDGSNGGKYDPWLSIFKDLGALKTRVAKAAGQEENGLTLSEFRFLARESGRETAVNAVELTSYGRKSTLSSPDKDARLTYGFGAVITRSQFDQAGDEASLRVAEWPLHADANATVEVTVFKQVPTALGDLQDVPPYVFSPRPSHELDPDLREKIQVPKDLENSYVRIRYCPDFVDADEVRTNKDSGDKSLGDPYEVVLPDHGNIHPRSDLQSAVSAYFHFDWFFGEAEALGLNPSSLLRHLKLPVNVHYRSGVAPGRGKDGETVNARVALTNDIDADFLPQNELVAHVHLALANLNRWYRDVPADGNFEVHSAQPLGIANDRRWIIHEIGHVLIAGSLGELELRFVHSVGDALAAVLSDPESRISEADPNGPWVDFRFQTFPWVDVVRRHDRTVLTGWSWSGSMHQDVLHTPELQLRGLKAYNTEQILSSTLFRLYRILGGDTEKPDAKPDVTRRKAASRVVLYLVLRAIETFVHWPLRAEELESAMIDADICLSTKLQHGLDEIWKGGQAHKVIRWAFEAQGLHPPDPLKINNEPGAAPPVDIFIKDQRTDLEHTFAGVIDHKAGSYVPVSLHWDVNAAWTGGTLSLANPAVIIGNRGTQPVTPIHARAWWGLWFGGNVIWSPEVFPGLDTKKEVAAGTFVLQNVDLVMPFVPQLAQPLLLIEITCPEDRANTDPGTKFASAIKVGDLPPSDTWEIADLVSTDNNLGLFWVTQ